MVKSINSKMSLSILLVSTLLVPKTTYAEVVEKPNLVSTYDDGLNIKNQGLLISQPSVFTSLVYKEVNNPPNVIVNPGSMNWIYKGTNRGSTRVADLGTYFLGKLYTDGLSYLSSQIKVPVVSELSAAAFQKLNNKIQRDKTYYYINYYYYAKDGAGILTKVETNVYSDSSYTKLVSTTVVTSRY